MSIFSLLWFDNHPLIHENYNELLKHVRSVPGQFLVIVSEEADPHSLPDATVLSRKSTSSQKDMLFSCIRLLLLFVLIFGGHMSFLCGHWYPCFGLLVKTLGFKARVGSLTRTWCDTCWPLGGQHGSQAVLFHIPVSRLYVLKKSPVFSIHLLNHGKLFNVRLI